MLESASIYVKSDFVTWWQCHIIVVLAIYHENTFVILYITTCILLSLWYFGFSRPALPTWSSDLIQFKWLMSKYTCFIHVMSWTWLAVVSWKNILFSCDTLWEEDNHKYAHFDVSILLKYFNISALIHVEKNIGCLNINFMHEGVQQKDNYKYFNLIYNHHCSLFCQNDRHNIHSLTSQFLVLVSKYTFLIPRTTHKAIKIRWINILISKVLFHFEKWSPENTRFNIFASNTQWK